MTRSPLPASVVDRIRRERYAPRRRQCDYLHLADLHRGLQEAFDMLPPSSEPALDLYCGTQPYRAMIPRRFVVGTDRDDHFARADVVADLPLPFRDETFSLVVCTQALYIVDDPAAVVREMRRVLVSGGHAVVTMPHIFRREIPAERKLSEAQVRDLFVEWKLQLHGIGGPGSAITYFPGTLAIGAARRWPVLRPLLPPLGLTLTALGSMLNAVGGSVARRWPATWVAIAQRPMG